MLQPSPDRLPKPNLAAGFAPAASTRALPGLDGSAASGIVQKSELSPVETDAFLKAFSQALRKAAAEPATQQFRQTLLQAQKQDAKSRNAAMAEQNYQIVFDSMLIKHLRKQLPTLSDKTKNGQKYMQALRTSLGIYHTTRQREAAAVLEGHAQAEQVANAAQRHKPSLLQGFAAAGKSLVLRKLDTALHGAAKKLVRLGHKIEALRPTQTTIQAQKQTLAL
ncbi:MAG: hypothetical protein KBA75_09615 [Alphaproteobacteria bacterium]|nr:hypothetical protein [Alphaproteobacteria bacterium]